MKKNKVHPILHYFACLMLGANGAYVFRYIKFLNGSEDEIGHFAILNVILFIVLLYLVLDYLKMKYFGEGDEH